MFSRCHLCHDIVLYESHNCNKEPPWKGQKKCSRPGAHFSHNIRIYNFLFLCHLKSQSIFQSRYWPPFFTCTFSRVKSSNPYCNFYSYITANLHTNRISKFCRIKDFTIAWLFYNFIDQRVKTWGKGLIDYPIVWISCHVYW